VLERLELAGSSIAVEITEGLLMDATESVMGRLEGLREAGMTISLDDFGTGYSSLTYLQRFAIDNIKIDQSYVRNLHAGAPDLALCKAIITMAHELGMRVVAEGVETIAQCDLLINAGCDMGQGFLFAKPMSPAEFECFFSKHKPAQAAD
jgi:EAL domain-containing protein (putative c-di-GMP-specific phosphodiesterase class I)